PVEGLGPSPFIARDPQPVAAELSRKTKAAVKPLKRVTPDDVTLRRHGVAPGPLSKKSGDAMASRDIVNCIARRSGSWNVAVIDRGHSRLARTTLTSVPMTKICTIKLTYARSPMVDAKGPESPTMRGTTSFP